MIKKHDRDQPGPGDHLAGPLVDHPVADDRQRERRVEQLAVRGDQGEEQGAEGDEDEPVRDADRIPLQHPGVPEGLGQHVFPALARMITPAGSGLAELDHADDRAAARAKSTTPTIETANARTIATTFT